MRHHGWVALSGFQGQGAQHPGFPAGSSADKPRQTLSAGVKLLAVAGASLPGAPLSTEPQALEAVSWSQGSLSTPRATGTGAKAQKAACRVIGSKWNGSSCLPVILFSNSLTTYPDSQLSQYTGLLSMPEIEFFCIFNFLRIYRNLFTVLPSREVKGEGELKPYPSLCQVCLLWSDRVGDGAQSRGSGLNPALAQRQVTSAKQLPSLKTSISVSLK